MFQKDSGKQAGSTLTNLNNNSENQNFIRIREEKTTDILATDETYENFEFNQSDKFILKPLIGYTKKEIEEIYNLVKEII